MKESNNGPPFQKIRFFSEAGRSFQSRKMVTKLGIHSDLAFPKFLSIPKTCCGEVPHPPWEVLQGNPFERHLPQGGKNSGDARHVIQGIQVSVADPKSNDIQ